MKIDLLVAVHVYPPASPLLTDVNTFQNGVIQIMAMMMVKSKRATDKGAVGKDRETTATAQLILSCRGERDLLLKTHF